MSTGTRSPCGSPSPSPIVINDPNHTVRGSTSTHYESHSAESYDEAYFYKPGPYQEYLVELVLNRLELRKLSTEVSEPMLLQQKSSITNTSNHILDVGGGTGTFASALLQHPDTSMYQHKFTIVDPFLGPNETSTANSSEHITFVKAGAEIFDCNRVDDVSREHTEIRQSLKERHGSIHGILLKEVVHHLDDREAIFQGMYEDLNPNGIILIITRPQVDIDYPLWDAARHVWKENQPSTQDFILELQKAGFTSIHETLEAYPCTVAFTRWQKMVKNRFWSTFSNFSDDDLQIACDRMEVDYKDRIDQDGVLHFEDRLVFLSAKKKAS